LPIVAGAARATAVSKVARPAVRGVQQDRVRGRLPAEECPGDVDMSILAGKEEMG
jgi:hypothetical protein